MRAVHCAESNVPISSLMEDLAEVDRIRERNGWTESKVMKTRANDVRTRKKRDLNGVSIVCYPDVLINHEKSL